MQTMGTPSTHPEEHPMKTWIKRTLIGLAATATLLGGFAALAHRHDGMRFGWRAITPAEAAPLQGRMIERAASKLDLDAAQKAKLGALAERLRETRNAMVATSADPREELQAALAGPRLDRGRINTLVQAQLATAGAQSPALINAVGDFYDSLRPAQQAELREMLQKGRERREGRDGRGKD
jgi:periplasmic protein CpxP/Spy